jgi:ABC-type antimicrobial peptide transport system permease subunit
VVIENIRQRMRQKYPDTSVEFSVLQTQVRDGLIRERLLAMLAGFFGILAIALTVVGLYGMLSYSVAQRRPEIGVRLALGARSEQVVGMMMRETATLLVAGSLAGLLISVFAGRTAASLLFGVRASDPLILGGACALLAAIAAAASFLPARRASRINPAQVLTGS